MVIDEVLPVVPGMGELELGDHISLVRASPSHYHTINRLGDQAKSPGHLHTVARPIITGRLRGEPYWLVQKVSRPLPLAAPGFNIKGKVPEKERLNVGWMAWY